MKRWISGVAALALATAAAPADAFCGFYVGGANAKLFNDATVVVLMREDTRTVLSMQNAYKGPPEKFAMVVPVPIVLQEENVKTLPRELFDKVDQLAAPRLVEYWEQDPCAPPEIGGLKGAGMRRSAYASAPAAPAQGDLGVKIEAQFKVGEYEIVVLSAQDSGGLDTWLRREKYTIPEGAEPYFRPYVASGSKFFVARVDPAKVKMEDGVAVLSPLRFHYDSDEFRLPVRLGLINSSGTQDLIVHILAKGKRYQVANYPNVTIPTNLDVSEAASDEFGSFYARLFDRTLEKNPKAVVTEYAWDAGTCDPCPGPTLTGVDVVTLGADVLPSSLPAARKDAGAKAAPVPFSPWMGNGFTLTRLHARYTKDSLGEDLVFSEAPPISGGREVRNREGKLETGSQSGAGMNNFQARYAIRHPWTGPIACKEPRRGVWGGPPGKEHASNLFEPPKAAKKLGLVARSPIDLASVVKQDVPEIDLRGGKLAPLGGAASGATNPADAPQSKKGCLGCATIPRESSDLSAVALVAAGAALGVARRRRRRV